MTVEASAAETGRYPQQLRRGLDVAGNVAVTVSNITPTASVFVVAPVLFGIAGSGAFWSLLIAALMSLCLALCWCELGSAFPFAGGDYPIVTRVLGRPVGFVSLAAAVVQTVVIPSSIALGAGEYLSVVWPGANANLVSAAFMAVTAGVAALSIRVGAWVTGVFLALELLALLTLSVVGFSHVAQSPAVLLAPQGSHPVSLNEIVAGVAVAMYAYTGYQAAVSYSEETRGARRNVARAVLWALGISVVSELVSIVAVLLAAPSLARLSAADSPIQYVVASAAGPALNTALSLGVVVAIFNAAIAINLHFSRWLFSAGRDRAWPEPISGWFASLHPRFRSPWVAVAFIGAVGVLFSLVSSLAAVVTFIGSLELLIYALIALCAIVSRLRQPGLRRPYRLPFWPIPPLVALLALAIVATRQKPLNLAIAAGIAAVALLYYALYLRPRRGTRWLTLAAPEGDEVEPLSAAAARPDPRLT
jgi:amino acid transporter